MNFNTISWEFAQDPSLSFVLCPPCPFLSRPLPSLLPYFLFLLLSPLSRLKQLWMKGAFTELTDNQSAMPCLWRLAVSVRHRGRWWWWGGGGLVAPGDTSAYTCLAQQSLKVRLWLGLPQEQVVTYLPGDIPLFWIFILRLSSLHQIFLFILFFYKKCLITWCLCLFLT